MPSRKFNQTRPFNHITQKGKIQLKKLSNSDGRGITLFGGKFACAFACIAMISGKKLEQAINDFIEVGLSTDEISWVLNKYGLKLGNSIRKIDRGRFKGRMAKRKFLNAILTELEKSTESLLIRVDGHVLLFDYSDGMIKDPDNENSISIEKFIKDYSKIKINCIEFFPIKQFN